MFPCAARISLTGYCTTTALVAPDTDDGLSPSTTCRLRPYHGIMALRGPRRCLTTDDMDGISRVRYERRDVQIDVVGVDNSWHPILTTLWKPKRVKGTQTQSIITTCAGAQTQSISTVEVATQTDPFDCPVPQPLPSSIPLCELNLLPPPCVMEPPQHGLGVSGVRDPGYTHVYPTPNLNLNPKTCISRGRHLNILKRYFDEARNLTLYPLPKIIAIDQFYSSWPSIQCQKPCCQLYSSQDMSVPSCNFYEKIDYSVAYIS